MEQVKNFCFSAYGSLSAVIGQQYGIKYQNIMVTGRSLKKLVRFPKKANKVFSQNLTSFFDLQPGDFPTRLWQYQTRGQSFKRWVTHEVLPSIGKPGFYKLEREVSEYKDKALNAYEWYHQASLECQALQERYRKSHSPLDAYEIAQIQNLARQDSTPRQKHR